MWSRHLRAISWSQHRVTHCRHWWNLQLLKCKCLSTIFILAFAQSTISEIDICNITFDYFCPLSFTSLEKKSFKISEYLLILLFILENLSIISTSYEPSIQVTWCLMLLALFSRFTFNTNETKMFTQATKIVVSLFSQSDQLLSLELHSWRKNW